MAGGLGWGAVPWGAAARCRVDAHADAGPRGFRHVDSGVRQRQSGHAAEAIRRGAGLVQVLLTDLAAQAGGHYRR